MEAVDYISYWLPIAAIVGIIGFSLWMGSRK